MAFTDEDLKWWRQEHSSPMSKALLARLDAAEAIGRYIDSRHHEWINVSEIEPLGEAWRKACGR
jgi:hypothetical protein